MESLPDSNGMIYNFTGGGKGKTSAAFGVLLRALGWHWRVAILQFMKGTRETGEWRFFQEYFPEVPFFRCGLGLTTHPGDHAAYARQGWEKAKELLRSFPGELLLLDELNVALHHGFLPVPEVIECLQQRREGLHVLITGRNAPQELLAICDLVSDIQEVRHPFQHGIPACQGLDF